MPFGSLPGKEPGRFTYIGFFASLKQPGLSIVEGLV
jgi:hypothetical protein